MSERDKPYIPAAGRHWLLPLYDPFTKLLGVEGSHRRLLSHAAIRPRDRLLEIGCGTGNLSILVKRQNPETEVVGIDPDPTALARARRKAERRGIAVQFDLGFAEELPYPDASFDRAFSAFMFHHLQPAARESTLREVRRVLKPGGSLHLVDFAEGSHPSIGHHAAPLHRSAPSRFQYSVLGLLRDAGFPEAAEVAHRSIILGRLAYYAAPRPAG